MFNTTDVVVVSSDEDGTESDSSNHVAQNDNTDTNLEGLDDDGQISAENESISLVSVDDVDETSDHSDCEIVDVVDLHGESKWCNFNDPVRMLNALLQAGYNDPGLLLTRIFGLHRKSLPSDSRQRWGLLLSLMTEPTPRPRLPHVNSLENVLQLLSSCQNILVVTGAGVSVSCGIPDFRSRDGIYARLAKDYPDLSSPQAMFDMTYFLRNPTPFFKFAKEIFPGQFSPSLTHRFVSLLEAKDKLLRNYTQNIDTLEQLAGITRLIQCHGSFATATCVTCKYRIPGNEIKESVISQIIPFCPHCHPTKRPNGDESGVPELNDKDPGDGECSSDPVVRHRGKIADLSGPCFGVMKPDIVFFGEDLSSEFHDTLADDVNKTDLVLVIGSSLKVRPVAHIPNSIPRNIPQILINREPLSNHDFDVELFGNCDVIVQQLCSRLKWELDDVPVHETQTFIPLSDLSQRRSKTEAGSAEPQSVHPTVHPSTSDEPNEKLLTPSVVTPDKSLNSSTIVETLSESAPDSQQRNNADAIGEVPGVSDMEGEVVELSDSDGTSDSDLNDLLDVAALLPPNAFTRVPPNQYIFHGAEYFINVTELSKTDDANENSSEDDDSPAIRLAHTSVVDSPSSQSSDKPILDRLCQVSQQVDDSSKLCIPESENSTLGSGDPSVIVTGCDDNLVIPTISMTDVSLSPHSIAKNGITSVINDRDRVTDVASSELSETPENGPENKRIRVEAFQSFTSDTS